MIVPTSFIQAVFSAGRGVFLLGDHLPGDPHGAGIVSADVVGGRAIRDFGRDRGGVRAGTGPVPSQGEGTGLGLLLRDIDTERGQRGAGGFGDDDSQRHRRIDYHHLAVLDGGGGSGAAGGRPAACADRRRGGGGSGRGSAAVHSGRGVRGHRSQAGGRVSAAPDRHGGVELRIGHPAAERGEGALRGRRRGGAG